MLFHQRSRKPEKNQKWKLNSDFFFSFVRLKKDEWKINSLEIEDIAVIIGKFLEQNIIMIWMAFANKNAIEVNPKLSK